MVPSEFSEFEVIGVPNMALDEAEADSDPELLAELSRLGPHPTPGGVSLAFQAPYFGAFSRSSCRRWRALCQKEIFSAESGLLYVADESPPEETRLGIHLYVFLSPQGRPAARS